MRRLWKKRLRALLAVVAALAIFLCSAGSGRAASSHAEQWRAPAHVAVVAEPLTLHQFELPPKPRLLPTLCQPGDGLRLPLPSIAGQRQLLPARRRGLRPLMLRHRGPSSPRGDDSPA